MEMQLISDLNLIRINDPVEEDRDIDRRGPEAKLMTTEEIHGNFLPNDNFQWRNGKYLLATTSTIIRLYGSISETTTGLPNSYSDGLGGIWSDIKWSPQENELLGLSELKDVIYHCICLTNESENANDALDRWNTSAWLIALNTIVRLERQAKEPGLPNRRLSQGS